MTDDPIHALTLVKIGGAIVSDPGALAAFWSGVRALGRLGPVVIVHGGGPQSTALARRLGHEPRMVAGRRVTTDLDLDVAKWTLRGALNADLVASAAAAGIAAVGISGIDGGLVRAVRRPPRVVDGETVDFGHVGDLTAVDPALVRALLGGGFVPVVCPLAAGPDGAILNVNADTVARALAEALGATCFRLVTESGGVRRDAADPASLLPALDAATFENGVAAGWISGGMRPKLEVAFAARAAGVPDVSILGPDDLAAGRPGTRVT